MTRRALFVAGGASMLALSLGVAGRGLLHARRWRRALTTRFSLWRRAAAVGIEARHVLGPPAPDETALMASATDGWHHLMEAGARDLRAGRQIRLFGWTLSQTEAQVYATLANGDA